MPASYGGVGGSAQVTVQYNLCNEPWTKYSMSTVADRGLKPSQWTSARLHHQVLYLETHRCRPVLLAPLLLPHSTEHARMQAWAVTSAGPLKSAGFHSLTQSATSHHQSRCKLATWSMSTARLASETTPRLQI